MSGRKVFLDVGGHVGESLGVAMQPRWRFDRIWTFEPTSGCCDELARIADSRVTVVRAGWWSTNREMDVHDPGTLWASVEASASRKGEVETCRFIDAAAWMSEHIERSDEVWLKINIEAAEVEVLERLIDTGEIGKVAHLVVHFDVERIGLGHRAVAMRARLDDAGVPWSEAHEVLFGRTASSKLESWLALTHGRRLEFIRRWVAHQGRRRVFLLRRSVRRLAGEVQTRSHLSTLRRDSGAS